MSTRCHIEIYDKWPQKSGPDKEHLGARLYHHTDGYPRFMQGKLERFLKAAYEYLQEANYPYWWDSERVTAVLIALSIEDYDQPLKPFSTNRANKFSGDDPHLPNGGVPTFQPCLKSHFDVAYVWKVVLGKEGEFEIKHRQVNETKWHDKEEETTDATT